MIACPICEGTRLVSVRRGRGLPGFVYASCWACTPQPLRAA